MCLVSCSSENGKVDPTPTPTPDPVKIPINISMDVWTRVTDTAYESGDKVGIYVVNYQGASSGTLQSSGNYVDNMCFTYAGNWTPESEIYWKDETTKANFYCYYPYGEPSDIAAYPFSVKTDQSQQADYKASEFLWGKASGISPTANAVPIITNRSMSNMLIYVAPGKGFTEETLAAATKSVRICNVKASATVDLRTGVATAVGSATEIVPYNEGTYYRALLVPQTVADGSNLVTITVEAAGPHRRRRGLYAGQGLHLQGQYAAQVYGHRQQGQQRSRHRCRRLGDRRYGQRRCCRIAVRWPKTNCFIRFCSK